MSTTVTAYQYPPPKPAFNPSSFRAYASVNTSGSVSVRGYGASVARYSPSSFGTVSSPTRRSITVYYTVPSGYSNTGRQLSTTVTAYQYPPPKPAFNPRSFRAYASVSTSGSVSVRGYGASVARYSPSSFGTVSSPTRRSITVYYTVPSGYSNTGRQLSTTVTAYQYPPPKPAFNPSSFRAYASVSTSGSVSVRGYGASVARYSPSSFGTVSSPTRRSITVYYTVPSGYSNTGRQLSTTVTAYQYPPPKPAFNPSSFRAYASVSTSGRVSVRGYGASVARYSPSSFGTVSSRTRRSITVYYTVPSGYSNTGRQLSTTVTAYQDPPTFDSSKLWGYGGVNSQTGKVHAWGYGATFLRFSPSSFPKVSSRTRRSITLHFRVPSGYSNTGNEITKVIYTYQNLPAFDPNDFKVSATIYTQTGRVSVRGFGATLKRYSPSSFPVVNSRTLRTVTVYYTVPSGYSDSGQERSKNISIYQNPQVLNTYYRDADRDGFGDSNNWLRQASAPSGYVLRGGDCNDNNQQIHPNTLWYFDGDRDGFGAVRSGSDPVPIMDDGEEVLETHERKTPAPIRPPVRGCNPPNRYYSLQNNDPDDSNRYITPAPRRYYYYDSDGDGFGKDSHRVFYSIAPKDYVARGGDCNDEDPNRHPNTRWYVDADGDGWGVESTTGMPPIYTPGSGFRDDPEWELLDDGKREIRGCNPPESSGYTTQKGDLDDNDPKITNVPKFDCNKLSSPAQGRINSSGHLQWEASKIHFSHSAKKRFDWTPTSKTHTLEVVYTVPQGYTNSGAPLRCSVAVVQEASLPKLTSEDMPTPNIHAGHTDFALVKSPWVSQITIAKAHREFPLVTVDTPREIQMQLRVPDTGYYNSGELLQWTVTVIQKASEQLTYYADSDQDGLGDPQVTLTVFEGQEVDQNQQTWVTNDNDQCPDAYGPEENKGCPLDTPEEEEEEEEEVEFCAGDTTGDWTTARPSSDQNYILTKVYQNAQGTQALSSVQYYDGLGRPTQHLAVGHSPSGLDLVSQLHYDGFGRQNISYLPTPIAGSAGSYRSGVAAQAVDYYGENNPYQETVFEASPLNRVKAQRLPALLHRVLCGTTTRPMLLEK